MKQHNFALIIVVALLVATVLSGCQPIQPTAGGQPAAAAIPYMIIQHPVADFAQWQEVFDSKADLRKSSGEKSAFIFHDAADPNQLTLVMEWDSIENAQKYTQNPDLKTAMEAAGGQRAAQLLLCLC